MKSYIEYYKQIMTNGFPQCIKCASCVDCCEYVCICVRCDSCNEILNICSCDNELLRYSNQTNDVNNLMWKFTNFNIRETPFIEEIFNDTQDDMEIDELQ